MIQNIVVVGRSLVLHMKEDELRDIMTQGIEKYCN